MSKNEQIIQLIELLIKPGYPQIKDTSFICEVPLWD
jgi:hypothetical protein